LIVLDASAALAWLLKQPESERIAARVVAADSSLHAPHLIDLEFVHVMRR
jgi:predicted nucleic acid-binding protein